MTVEDGSRRSKEITGFFYGDRELEKALRSMLPSGEKACPMLLRGYEEDE